MLLDVTYYEWRWIVIWKSFLNLVNSSTGFISFSTAMDQIKMTVNVKWPFPVKPDIVADIQIL